MKGLGLLVVTLAACSPPPLDATMAGAWWGSAEVALQSGGAREFYPTLTVTVDDRAATVDGLCLLVEVDGSVVTTGEAGQAAWRGNLECPPLPDRECPIVLVYSEVSVSYDGDFGSISVDGTGTATRCAVSDPFTMSFFGFRP